jgi:hypothetical protein
MSITIVRFAAAALAVASVTQLAACGSNHSRSGGEAVATGSVSLPLQTVSNGITFRLENVELFVEGPTFQSVFDENPSESVITTSLPTGNYTAFLEDYQLTRDDGTGNFEPVTATLVSSFDQEFSIYNGTTTTLVFTFQTDGVIVTVGAGTLDVTATVNVVPAVCTPFGTDCPAGTWCPSAELTGAARACVPAGPVPVGQACNGPSDCTANASCFDFGSGPTCAALCPASGFNALCPGGGTCIPAGSDFGICTPAGAGSTDGGVGAAPDAASSACFGSPPLTPSIVGSPQSPTSGSFAFAGPGLVAPTVTIPRGPDGSITSVQVTATPGLASDPTQNFVGFGLSFGVPACLDASAFTGISFVLTGDLGTCALSFDAIPSEDNAVANGTVGTCTATQCLSPGFGPILPGPTFVPFSAMTGGTPLATVDSSALNGISWLLVPPTDGESAPCTASFTISSIAFANE